MDEPVRFYVDNIHSFWFNREESAELIGRKEHYDKVDANNQQVSCYKVPSYNNNIKKQHTRCEIEVDFIFTRYGDCKLYYFSPLLDRPFGRVALEHLNCIEMLNANAPFHVTPNAIWIIDERASLQLILHLLNERRKEEKNPKRIIFFIMEDNEKLLKALGA